QPRQACLDVESCLRLQVREVPVTVGEASEKLGVELEPGVRVDRIETVLLINRLPADDRPAAGTLLEKVVKAAGAYDVDEHPRRRPRVVRSSSSTAQSRALRRRRTSPRRESG